jgi:hypothetical protein
MDELLTIDELKTRYPDEHLLLVDYVNDEHDQITAGRVLCHSKNAEEMWRQGNQLQPKRSAHVYTGTIPDDIVFVL